MHMRTLTHTRQLVQPVFPENKFNSLPSPEELMIDVDVTLTRRSDLLIVVSCDGGREFCSRRNCSCQEPLVNMHFEEAFVPVTFSKISGILSLVVFFAYTPIKAKPCERSATVISVRTSSPESGFSSLLTLLIISQMV